MEKFIVIQDKEGGNQFAALRLWEENGVKRFKRCTEFTPDKAIVESFIARASAVNA